MNSRSEPRFWSVPLAMGDSDWAEHMTPSRALFLGDGHGFFSSETFCCKLTAFYHRYHNDVSGCSKMTGVAPARRPGSALGTARGRVDDEVAV